MSTAVAVCDPTVLIGLSRAGQLGLLRRLFDHVLVPPAVLDEVTRHRSKPGAEEILGGVGVWLRVQPPASVPVPPYPLDDGEWEAILLFEEVARSPGLRAKLMLDDRPARAAAERRGLAPMGVVGLLLLARRRGLLPEIRPTLDALRDSGFRLSDVLYKHALAAAGELEP